MTSTEIEEALTSVEWREPWHSAGEHAGALSDQLRRELVRGHALFGRGGLAIARRQDCDDVLFLVDNPPGLAVVHLTWVGAGSEHSPHTEFFDSPQAFIDRMKLDHVSFTAEGPCFPDSKVPCGGKPA